MRWRAKENTNKHYAPGEIKKIYYFPIIPRKFGDFWWWLEPVYVYYKCNPVYPNLYSFAYNNMKEGRSFTGHDLSNENIEWVFVDAKSKVDEFVEKL